MAIQTLQTIKNWFKTNLKPTQAQFWDTWDSFRHKYEKVPVEDVDGIDELLAEAINQIPTLNGNPNAISKFNSSGNGLENSSISDDGNKVLINEKLEIDSKSPSQSGLKFTNLKNEESAITGPVNIVTGITGYTNGSAIDSKGNIYLYEELGGTSIYKINSFTNAVTRLATLPSRVDGVKVADSDNVYFTYITYEEGGTTSIGKISPNGIVTDVLINMNGYFGKMALDTETEDLYLTRGDEVIKVTSSGLVSTFIPSISIGSVNCMAVDYNHNLILALSNSTILKVKPDQTKSVLTTLNSPASPRSMLIDKNNTIYTANYYSDNIAAISQTGETRYIGDIGEYNAELGMDNDGNFLTVAHNARKLYLTTPEGVSRILGDTSEFPRLPLVNSKNEIFVSNYYGQLQKYVPSYKGALTVDENGNVVLYDNKATGGSQDLQQTLDKGNVTSKNAIFRDNNYTSIINASDISVNEPTVGTTSIQPSNIQLLNPTGNVGAMLKKDGLSLYDDSGQNSSRLIHNSESTYSANFKFPLKTNNSDDQTLASIEDITLQKAVDNDGIAKVTSPNGENSASLVLFAADGGLVSGFGGKYETSNSQFTASLGKALITQDYTPDEDKYSSSLEFETPFAAANSGGARFKIPAKDPGEYILATTNDFMTINGESIIGDGDISISAGAASGLDATLAAKNHADSPIILSDYYVSPEYYQGLKLFASTGNTFLQNHYSGGITGFLELKPGNLGLWQAATDSTGNSASMEISGGGWGRAPEITFNKRINGEYSLCSVKAADPSEIDDLTTKGYVDSKVIAKAGIDSPVFTGVPSVPTAAISTNTTQVASTAFVNAAIENSIKDLRPYKIYTALLTQTEENDPTAIVLENTLGGEIVWTRMYRGAYTAVLAGAFTVGKTAIFTTPGFSEMTFLTCIESNYDSDVIFVQTCQGPWDLSDGMLRKTSIEIKVYN